MKIGLSLLFACLNLFSIITFAKTLSPELTEKDSVVIDAANVVFAGHATAFWDQSRKTESATRKMLELGQENHYYRIATAAQHMTTDVALAEMHYFEQTDVDLLVSSRAGSHRLLFPRLKNVFFAGGNLNRCLCEGIRDVAIGLYQSSPTDFDVNFVLVTDAIYAAYNPFSPIVEEAVAYDFAKTFFVPSFNCPLQNWGRAVEKRIEMPDLQINVFFSGNFLGSLDTEPNNILSGEDLRKKINLHFIQSNEIEGLMTEWKQ